MKRFFVLISVTVIIFSFTGCADKVVSFDISGAAKITVFSGSTGRELEITDASAIGNITDDINCRTFIREKSSKHVDGFSYQVKWYDSQNNLIEEITLMSGNKISYDGYFYIEENSDSQLCLDYIESLYPDE